MKITFDTVRKIGLAMPDVEDGTTYGTPALKVRGKLLTCIPSNKQAEPDSVVVMIGFERRSQLLDADPDVYYLKDHYVGHPCVLARLARIKIDALRELMTMSYQFVTAPKRKQQIKRR